MRILIIEDSEAKIIALRKVMRELEISDYMIARNAEEARKTYNKIREIDIIVLDMRFPMDNRQESYICTGDELLRQIQLDYTKFKLPIPKVIIYSIICLTVKNPKEMPKCFYGQAITAAGVKGLIMRLI